MKKGTLKKSAVLAAVCMALLCVSAHGEGTPQEQKKSLNDVKEMVEKFLHKGLYIKVDGGNEGFVYVLAAQIQSIGVVDGGLAISWGSDAEGFDLEECRISLDSECNLIIKEKK